MVQRLTASGRGGLAILVIAIAYCLAFQGFAGAAAMGAHAARLAADMRVICHPDRNGDEPDSEHHSGAQPCCFLPGAASDLSGIPPRVPQVARLSGTRGTPIRVHDAAPHAAGGREQGFAARAPPTTA